jgi:hypothetical protein
MWFYFGSVSWRVGGQGVCIIITAALQAQGTSDFKNAAVAAQKQQ